MVIGREWAREIVTRPTRSYKLKPEKGKEWVVRMVHLLWRQGYPALFVRFQKPYKNKVQVFGHESSCSSLFLKLRSLHFPQLDLTSIILSILVLECRWKVVDQTGVIRLGASEGKRWNENDSSVQMTMTRIFVSCLLARSLPLTTSKFFSSSSFLLLRLLSFFASVSASTLQGAILRHTIKVR